MSSCLPDIWRHIRSSLFDGQHHDGDDDRDSDAGEDSQGTGSDQLVWILQKVRGNISIFCLLVDEVHLTESHFIKSDFIRN